MSLLRRRELSVDQILDTYWKRSESIHQHPAGRDLFVELGLDGRFEKLLKQGQQPSMLIDDIMLGMVETRSVRGVEICLAAGADPLAKDSIPGGEFTGRTAIECAYALGFTEIASILVEKLHTCEYKRQLEARRHNQWRTLYAPQ